MSELTERRVIRSDNNPIGDYCEFLVAAHYGVEPEGNSTAGHDVVTPDGLRVQVKGRRIRRDGRMPPHYSAIRNLDDDPPPFDLLVGLLLDRDFSVREAWQFPVAQVRRYAVYRQHTNSWSLRTSSQVIRADPEIQQIDLRRA
jgi:hypothetical protein